MAPYDPTITVEVAFGYGPNDSSPVWTDISQYVLSGEITTGRTSEFDYFPAGTCTITLKDETRLFDPLNSSGTYYGDLVPNVPIRVTATHEAFDYPRFYGYVDGWELQPAAANNFGVVTVTATDGTKLLARAVLPSVYQWTVLQMGPDLYWPLGSDGGSMQDISGNGRHGRYLPRSSTSGELVPYASGASSISEPIDEPVAVAEDDSWVNALSLDTSMMVSFWWKANSDDATGLVTLLVHFWPWFHLLAYPPADNEFLIEFGDVINYYVFSAALFDGEAHHIAVARDDSNTWSIPVNTSASVSWPVMLYVDGQQQAIVGSTGKSTISPQFIRAYVGPSRHISGNPVLDGAISDVSLHIGSAAWDLTSPATLNEAGRAPWDGDFPGTRIGRVLDLIGWPAALSDTNTGATVLGPAAIEGLSALDHLREVASTEGGLLFFSSDGKVTFLDAAALRADTSPEVTFSDDGSDSPYLAGRLRFTLDEKKIINKAVVTRRGGTPQTASDTASIAAYGEQAQTFDGLLFKDDRQSLGLAERIVALYKEPQVRADSWTVNPQAKPETWGDILGLDIGDHVALEATPMNTGSQVSVSLNLDQIVESFTPSTYTFTFTGSPRDPNIGSYFTWGTSDAAEMWNSGVWA